MSGYYYLDILLIVESDDKSTVNIYELKQTIIQSVKVLFGEAGEGNEVDIIKYVESERRAIVRCLANFYIKLRAAITLVTQVNNLPCSFHVIKASPFLISLLSNSKRYQH